MLQKEYWKEKANLTWTSNVTKRKKLFDVDYIDDNGEIEPYPIDDVIDTVCEWNYELILDADAHRNDPKDFKDYSEFQNKYDSLKAMEKDWYQKIGRWIFRICHGQKIQADKQIF